MSYRPGSPDYTRLPCVPSDIAVECDNCVRFKSFPADGERVIDATVVKWDGGMCPMKVTANGSVQRPVRRSAATEGYASGGETG